MKDAQEKPFAEESDIPPELEPVWDAKIEAAFIALRPKQQDFLLAYLRTGNAAESYRLTYNALAKDHLAGNCGAQILETNGMSAILVLFQEQKTHDLFLSIKTLREMAEATKPEWVESKDGTWENVGDVPDWGARKDAVVALTKLRGLNAAEKKEVSGSITIQSSAIDEAL